MNYNKEQFKNAKLMSNKEYLDSKNLTFEGQSKIDKDGDYKTFWSKPNKELYFVWCNI